MPDTTSWIVTTSGEHPVAEVAAALSAAGAEVGEVLSEIGVITLRCAAGRVAGLRRVAGVSDVSPGVGIDIGPPGSPDTW